MRCSDYGAREENCPPEEHIDLAIDYPTAPPTAPTPIHILYTTASGFDTEDSFDLHHVNAQRQRRGSDCALFTNAFAKSLYSRKDTHYTQCATREHLALGLAHLEGTELV